MTDRPDRTFPHIATGPGGACYSCTCPSDVDHEVHHPAPEEVAQRMLDNNATGHVKAVITDHLHGELMWAYDEGGKAAITAVSRTIRAIYPEDATIPVKTLLDLLQRLRDGIEETNPDA